MAFSIITADTPLNNLTLAREVFYAVNKRRRSMGWNNTFVSLPDTNSNLKKFIAEAQAGIHSCTEMFTDDSHGYCDPDLVLAGSSTLPTVWGEDNIYNAAGLTAAGRWRRIPEGHTPPTAGEWANYNWPGYSYGRIQERDIAGPWLWADIHAVLGKLTRTWKKEHPWTINSEYRATDESDVDNSATPDELPGNVSLTTEASSWAPGDPDGAKITYAEIWKAKTDFGYQARGYMKARLIVINVNDPGYWYAPADQFSVQRKIILIPRGDINAFSSVIGTWTPDVTNVVTDFDEVQFQTIERWFWGTPGTINQKSVSWSSLSSQLPYPEEPDSPEGLECFIHSREIGHVADFNFFDGVLK